MKIIVFFSFFAATLTESFSLSSLEFTATDSNPLISYGFGFSEATWNDPSVICLGDSLIMYASASRGFVLPKVSIYRLISGNGTEWRLSPDTAVIKPSTNSSSWNSGSVETPSVVFFEGKYHAFTTCYEINDPAYFRIGHSVSEDGITWVMDSIPLLAPTGNPLDFNGLVVGEPGAVVFKGEIYVYFTAIGIDTAIGATIQSIGLIKSANGTNYSMPQKVLSPDQSIYPRNSGWIGYSTPAAIAISDTLHLFTDVANDSSGWIQVALHHFYSYDGESRWTADTEPFLKREDTRWTKREIRAPSPVLFNNTLIIYFAGDELWTEEDGEKIWHTDRWGIGAISAPIDKTSFYKKSNKQIGAKWIKILQNPVGQNLSIEIFGNKGKPVEIMTYDISGKCLTKTTTSESIICLPSNHLPNGFILIKARSGTKEATLPVIKHNY